MSQQSFFDMFTKMIVNKIYWMNFLLLSCSNGQVYNMTGSSEYAKLGEPFTWTCAMFVPSGMSGNAVTFERNSVICGIIVQDKGSCIMVDLNSRYSFACLSENSYTLTIPAENMTEYEQRTRWRCYYPGDVSYRSPNVSLNIASDVHNVSIIPDDKPLTLREGSQKEVRCVVNSNAVPVPTFTWYLESTDITNIADSGTTSVIITGNRLDNAKTLQCRATNNNKPPKSSSTTLNVEYPPVVSTLVQQDIIEGQELLVTCQATPGNPSSTTFFWTKVDDLGFRYNGTNLQFFNIQRKSTGTYRCTGENNYSNGEIGKHSQDMVVNVLYIPTIETKPTITVNETETVVLKLKIDSNPLSNLSLYDGGKLLQTQTFVKTASLILEDVTCLDSKNFTLLASNVVQSNVTSQVEVIVNCRPKPEHSEINFALPNTLVKVTFATSVLAYPKPRYLLKYENGTRNNEMTVTLYGHSINNFTIKCEQQNVKENHLGTYLLEVSNFLGQSTILLHIIKQETLSTRTDSSSQTGVITGSIVGVLVLLTLFIVLSCFIRRQIFKERFTEGESIPVETADFSNDKAVYTTITEGQSENVERNPYDSLTPKEDTKSYEALQMRDNQEINTNEYECLKTDLSSCDYKKRNSNIYEEL